MPVIQQENGIKSIKGLPLRWGVRAYRELKASMHGVGLGEAMPERYTKLAGLLDAVTDAPLSLDTTDAQICLKAQQAATMCAGYAEQVHDMAALRARLAKTLAKMNVPQPDVETDRAYVARCIDAAWWRRQLRKVHGRAFEHAAIRLGFVSVRAGAYASNESVKRRIEQNKRNAKILHATVMENDCGQKFDLAELASKGTANKAIRRGELMLRVKGFETIARECGHDGLFITLTCPSKFHAVLQGSGQVNPKYQGATPNEAQLYLRGVWARIRAALARAKIALYGFRIAEPHHDGCPHWHMLVFVQPFCMSRAWALDKVQAIFREHALREDGDEPGADRQRVDFKQIDWSKGDAAGYIAKYVGKNIDDEHVGEHRDDGGTVAVDMAGDEVIKPCQRVEAWAATWGIRQFQQVGGAPVTVWRELRRIKRETIARSPEYIRDAWQAAQKIEAQAIGAEKTETIKAADFAEYLKSQGGAVPGRDYRIKIAKRESEIEGRYGLSLGMKPVGVYAVENSAAVYESVRYQWSRAGRGVEVDFSWTRVNNCTEPSWTEFAGTGEEPERIDDSEWYESAEFRKNEIFAHEKREIEEIGRQAYRESQAGNKAAGLAMAAHAWDMVQSMPGEPAEAVEPVQAWDFSRKYDKEGKLING